VKIRHDRLASENYDIIIAHVVSRRAKLDTLVVVDVFVLGVAAEQDDHFDLLYMFANQGDELLQILSFVRRQESDASFHNDKFMKISDTAFCKTHKNNYICLSFCKCFRKGRQEPLKRNSGL